MTRESVSGDFFKAVLIPLDAQDLWRYEALDFQSPPQLPAESRRTSVLHDREELQRFLNDMNIDSMIGWTAPETGEKARPGLIRMAPSEILSGIEAARLNGFLGSITICSSVTDPASGIASARAWFDRQRAEAGSA